jgi:hypothetical protein
VRVSPAEKLLRLWRSQPQLSLAEAPHRSIGAVGGKPLLIAESFAEFVKFLSRIATRSTPPVVTTRSIERIRLRLKPSV